MLQFDAVHYTYPGSQQTALNGISLKISAGRKSAIVGQNGCGKSTLLLLADGLIKPQKGTVRWWEKPLNYQRQSLMKLRQQLGLVFQDPEQQLVAATVAEDISYGLCNLRLPAAEIRLRVEKALVDFDLQELASRPVHHLSLGQKRRLAIAGVMVMQPKLLLLDEATAYLDSLQTRNFLLELDRIHATGTTIVLATHDLNLAYQWADWLFVMHQGRLVLEGNPQSVFFQREILEELKLGVPLLWEVWESLPERVRLGRTAPRTVEELRSRVQPIMKS